MRPILIATAIAGGLVALWVGLVPLTAQSAPKPPSLASSALSKALILCRGANGIDHACTTALARALTAEAPATAAKRTCQDDLAAPSLRD